MKLNFFLIFSLLFATGACTSKTEAPNILAVPKAIAIDKTNNRLFVAESEDNSLSTINLTTNEIIGGAPLLTTSSSIQLPSLVQDIEVANLGSGVSRLFIIGNSAAPRNRITVLDYDSTSGLRAASFSPIIVGTNTDADTSDILGGLSFDSVHSTLFVSNSSDNIVRAYNTTTGAEQTGSPITVNNTPMKLKVNSTLGKLFVTSLGSNNLSIINTADLTLSATSLDVGGTTDAVASATNSNGTALFVVSPSNNSIKVYQFNNITPSSSTQIASTVTPPSASASLSSSDVISGSLEECDAGVLSDEKIVAIFSESSSEMGYIQVSSDLSTLTSGRIFLPSAQGSMGIRILNNDSGNASLAYIAAPGGSAISIVNLSNSTYLGLIN